MPEPSPHRGTDLPAHPDRVDDAPPATDGGRWGIVVVALVGALLVLIVVLHITGVVGPGAH